MFVSLYKKEWTLWIVFLYIGTMGVVALNEEKLITVCKDQNKLFCGPSNRIIKKVGEIQSNPLNTTCKSKTDFSNYSVCVNSEVPFIITSFFNVHVSSF